MCCYCKHSHYLCFSEGLIGCQDGEDYSKDYVERDERRLADLGRRAVEMYIISQIFSELEVGPPPCMPVDSQPGAYVRLILERQTCIACMYMGWRLAEPSNTGGAL
jgi:hypothetical protein